MQEAPKNMLTHTKWDGRLTSKTARDAVLDSAYQYPRQEHRDLRWAPRRKAIVLLIWLLHLLESIMKEDFVQVTNSLRRVMNISPWRNYIRTSWNILVSAIETYSQYWKTNIPIQRTWCMKASWKPEPTVGLRRVTSRLFMEKTYLWTNNRYADSLRTRKTNYNSM